MTELRLQAAITRARRLRSEGEFIECANHCSVIADAYEGRGDMSSAIFWQGAEWGALEAIPDSDLTDEDKRRIDVCRARGEIYRRQEYTI